MGVEGPPKLTEKSRSQIWTLGTNGKQAAVCVLRIQDAKARDLIMLFY